MSDTSSGTPTELHVTPLHALHNELGAKMVPFAGYDMPVQYPAGVKTEHLHTRKEAGLFDVSHMGQLKVSGDNIASELEKLLPIDVGALAIHQQSYALLTNDDGGILDDLIITRWAEDTFFIVVNAACKEQDIAHFRKHLPNATIDVLTERALVALQGPSAKDVAEVIAPAACELTFMHGCFVTITCNETPVECYITRSGYTGEDGFEISIPNEHADAVSRLLLSFDCVEAIGLGARDSLRLEAGLCLYGHDMNTDTNPIDASLLWSISKSRRPGGAKAGGFMGADNIFAAIEKGSDRKRAGLIIDGRAPVREGAPLVDADGNSIGIVTSGGFGPSISKPIAIAYIDKTHAALGSEVFAEVRGKKLPVTVSKMPFVAQRYYRG
ncbi:glycine cleavage system aminomethyltransferase GcvT [Eionea flava]